MLSERERRELEIIERELSADTRLAASMARRPRRRFPRWLVRPRALIAFGGLLMVAGVLLDLGATFAQGLGLTVLGLGWWAWATEEPARDRQGRRPAPRR